jgi:hypothetical protein
LLRNEKDIGKVYNEDLNIETKAAVTRERRERLRKNWDFRSCFESARLQPLGKTAGVEKTFFAASGVATIRVMAPVVEMVISFSGDRNSSGVFSTPFG